MKFTVPNFINTHNLTSEDHYHLNEGYGVRVVGCKPSGKYYRKVEIEGNRRDEFTHHAVGQFLSYMGMARWWEKYQPNRSFFGRLFGTWKEIKK